MATRFATRRKRAFMWLPREATPQNDIKVDSVSVKTKIWSAECTRAIAPEIGFFKILLDNNNEEFSEVYSGGETVEFFIDLTDGTTRRFKGEIDTIKNKYDTGKGFTLELAGNHVSGGLLNITVTESFTGDTTVSDILDALNSTYLSGYTVNYTATDTTTKPTINWNNKPFWECITDLIKLISADAYVNDSLQINVFNKKSIINNNEAIVWNDTMISTEGLGTQSLTTRNKIIVYGEAGALPVISTSEDSISQSSFGTKEQVIFDSKITTEAMADELSAAELFIQKTPETEGKANAFILPSLLPGDMIWISNPVFKIQGQYKIYKYTHKFPSERTECFIQTSREIPHIFKKRIENELALQTVTNPFKMTSSWNFVFDDETEITTKDSNVEITGGLIKLNEGVQGTFTATKLVTSNVTNVHLKVIGSLLVGTIYKFSTDGGENIVDLSPETEITVPAGKNLWLKVEFNSVSSEINSLVVLSR
ncbi:hypothetical protein LCGC14_1555840 [marine sediment metagenome]|uniref:Tip attachment protein J domain-containing protein n=1 Tax=marine sediment metagenome TaxID=412755 RepID=A0A0F9INZ1_9ZZZZ